MTVRLVIIFGVLALLLGISMRAGVLMLSEVFVPSGELLRLRRFKTRLRKILTQGF